MKELEMVNKDKFSLDTEKLTKVQSLVDNIKKSTRTIRKTKDIISLSEGSVEFLGDTQLGDYSYKFCPHCIYNGSKHKTFSWDTVLRVIEGTISVEISDENEIFTMTTESEPYVIASGTKHYICQIGEEEAKIAVYTSQKMSADELE